MKDVNSGVIWKKFFSNDFHLRVKKLFFAFNIYGSKTIVEKNIESTTNHFMRLSTSSSFKFATIILP